MKSFHRIAVCGLLWLAFCAAASATQLTIESYNFSAAGDGGGFSAYLNGNSQDPFEVFCVDYRNEVSPPETYSVNIDVVGDTVANTRYGTTPTASFADQVMIDGSSVDAEMRYILAGWLTTQYNLNPGHNTALIDQDAGIQDSIWALLNTSSSNAFSFETTYEATWINNALNWASGETSAQLQSFADDVEVLTSSNVSGTSIADGRYNTGAQEMITVTPEPAGMALVGIGLLVLGLVGRRKLV